MENHDVEALREEISRAEALLAELDDERTHVSRRLRELKAQLSSLRQSEDASATEKTGASGNTPSTSEEKVALFMELFRSRADVFPKRWENANKGTKGYSPACSNEWVPGVCDKRNIKCGDCCSSRCQSHGEALSSNMPVDCTVPTTRKPTSA